jgi:hypothetical protein
MKAERPPSLCFMSLGGVTSTQTDAVQKRRAEVAEVAEMAEVAEDCVEVVVGEKRSNSEDSPYAGSTPQSKRTKREADTQRCYDLPIDADQTLPPLTSHANPPNVASAECTHFSSPAQFEGAVRWIYDALPENSVLCITAQCPLHPAKKLQKQKRACMRPHTISVWTTELEQQLKQAISMSNTAEICFIVKQKPGALSKFTVL